MQTRAMKLAASALLVLPLLAAPAFDRRRWRRRWRGGEPSNTCPKGKVYDNKDEGEMRRCAAWRSRRR